MLADNDGPTSKNGKKKHLQRNLTRTVAQAGTAKSVPLTVGMFHGKIPRNLGNCQTLLAREDSWQRSSNKLNALAAAGAAGISSEATSTYS